MKPILAILIAFFAIFLWQVTCSPYQPTRSFLYHTKIESFGCHDYELTAHLLFLKNTHPVDFTKNLDFLIKNQECRKISPDENWYKKTHYYNMTVLHTARWHKNMAPLKDEIVPTSDLTLIKSFEQGKMLPSDFYLLLAVLIFFVYWAHSSYIKYKAWKFILEHLTYHREKLAQKRLQLVHYDAYGVIHYEKWYKEINFFCSSYLVPNLKKKKLFYPWSKLEKPTKQLIHEWASLSASSQRVFSPPNAEKDSNTTPKNLYFSKKMSPLDYEKFCAQLLEQAGWETYLTPASSDQGADIIAIRNGVRLVVQCKLYSRPVGNRAVQEIFTAKEHQKAQIAAVASNAHYTRQAHQLAASTGVYLLHHKQLARFTEKTPLTHPISR